MAPGGTITGSGLPYLPGAPRTPQPGGSSYAPSATHDSEPEPDVIREWRERRDLAIQHRDEVSAERKAATVKAAQEAIDDFYENYNNKKEKGIAQTRREAEDFLSKREDTASGGTSWERIAKLVDLSGKGVRGGASGSEKARFRELLLSLRKEWWWLYVRCLRPSKTAVAELLPMESLARLLAFTEACGTNMVVKTSKEPGTR